MKYSLLYKTPDPREISDVAYDLSVDRAVRAVIPDARRADNMLTVLMKPLVLRENIVYRQNILKDFLALPQLYDDLKVIFNRYDKVKSDWREMRGGAYPSGGASNSRALVDYTFASLKVTAMFPKTIISFFRSISDTLSKYEIKSDGLCEIKRYCGEILGNDSLSELERTAALFAYKTPESFEFSVAAGLDETFRLASCGLCAITDISGEREDNMFAKLFRRKKSDGSVEIEDDEATNDAVLGIVNEALHRVDSALSQVTDGVYEVFYGLSGEMQFYDAAISYTGYMQDAGAPIVFPTVLEKEADSFSARGLCDPVLITDGIAAAEIVRNPIDIGGEMDGMLIRGSNKTGKTSYLRAVGAAQLFMQSGLPVCADSAEISIRSAIYTHFSSAEEEFRAGDTAGRFEGEVQLVDKIIRGAQSRPYSLILMNETFQTTSYSEGADGMHDILSALPKIKAKYIFVSRLAKLFELADKQRVKLVTMTDGFTAE
ncbi:MAG: hypothetical protein WCQ72_05310 [Eubacteriales bacterium]